MATKQKEKKMTTTSKVNPAKSTKVKAKALALPKSVSKKVNEIEAARIAAGEIPAVIEGKGFKLVNLRTFDEASMYVTGSAAGKELARVLNAWDASAFGYDLVHMVNSGRTICISLDQITMSESVDHLGSYAPELFKALERTILAHKQMIKELREGNKPVKYEFLAEVIRGFLSKNLCIRGSDGTLTYGTLLRCQKVRSFFSNFVQLDLTGTQWVNGKVQAKNMRVRLGPGEAKMLVDWGVISTPTPEMLQTLLERGKRVIDLNQRCAYVQVTGTLKVKVMWFTREVNAGGRAIVDPSGFALFNPNERDDYDEDQNGEMLELDQLTEDQIRSLMPSMTVFSFVSKKWGKVDVSQVSNIHFRDDAFEKLVMPEDEKHLVHTLVKNSDSSMVSDLIDNKGGGCVLLLHGKPGLGKTLTAEAVAETLRRPLYAVSVGELGTDPNALEEKLNTVLQTAQRWNAVLLLDEADVFLEERTSGDIARNAMVGTFLRLLEYYNGVLILTTNRVADIDKAFYSRVSLALRYGEFDVDTRVKVIENLLDTNGVKLDAETIYSLAKNNVNGRQIKNAIRIARYLAKDEARAVTGKDIESVLHKLMNFQEGFDKEGNAHA